MEMPRTVATSGRWRSLHGLTPARREPSASSTTPRHRKRRRKRDAWADCGGVSKARSWRLRGGRLDNVADLRRLLQIAVIDTLRLENSISRSRTLGYLAQVRAMLREQEQRLKEHEALLRSRLVGTPSQRRY